jgi:hypothetical protein
MANTNMAKIKKIISLAICELIFLSIILFPALVKAKVSFDIGFDFGFGGGGGGGGVGSGLGGVDLPDGSIFEILQNGMQWLLAIFGIIAVIGFVISGILYLTSAGNDDQITKAKSAMTWSIVGVIVGLMGIVVLNAIGSWLSGSNSNF